MSAYCYAIWSREGLCTLLFSVRNPDQRARGRNEDLYWKQEVLDTQCLYINLPQHSARCLVPVFSESSLQLCQVVIIISLSYRLRMGSSESFRKLPQVDGGAT